MKAAESKRYYEANKEKMAAQKKRYYEANKEKRVAQKKRYYEANKEKEAARKKKYYGALRAPVLYAFHASLVYPGGVRIGAVKLGRTIRWHDRKACHQRATSMRGSAVEFIGLSRVDLHPLPREESLVPAEARAVEILHEQGIKPIYAREWFSATHEGQVRAAVEQAAREFNAC